MRFAGAAAAGARALGRGARIGYRAAPFAGKELGACDSTTAGHTSMADSSIEWTDATWNPVAGCSVISPGCSNCYAMRMAARLDAMGLKKYRGLTRKSDRGD
jgi:hypothetical protein